MELLYLFSIVVWGLTSEGLFMDSRNSNNGIVGKVVKFLNNPFKYEFKDLIDGIKSLRANRIVPTHDDHLERNDRDPSNNSVADRIMIELQGLMHALREEKVRFTTNEDYLFSEKEKSKRLLYLFQKDLMPGISGQILESKDRRDEMVVKGVSRSAKWLAWMVIGMMNTCMLFYIFLFAVSQDAHRQRAWVQSFGLWLAVEVIFVSSAVVFFMHVLIPSLIMSDVNRVKARLLSSLQDYHTKMKNRNSVLTNYPPAETSDDNDPITKTFDEKKPSAKEKWQLVQSKFRKKRQILPGKGSAKNCEGEEDEEHDDHDESKDHGDDSQAVDTPLNKGNEESSTTFNAANHLFLSYKIATLYPELKVAQIILEFQTIWPKQSYLRTTDVSKAYRAKKFQAIIKAIGLIVMFFVTSFVSIPSVGIQDRVMEIVSTVIGGYLVLFHVKLYHFHPVLVIVPMLLIGIILHLIFQSLRARDKLFLLNFFSSSSKDETRDYTCGNNKAQTDGVVQSNQREARRALHPSVLKNSGDSEVSSTEELKKASQFVGRRDSLVQALAVANKAKQHMSAVKSEQGSTSESEEQILSDDGSSDSDDLARDLLAIIRQSDSDSHHGISLQDASVVTSYCSPSVSSHWNRSTVVSSIESSIAQRKGKSESMDDRESSFALLSLSSSEGESSSGDDSLDASAHHIDISPTEALIENQAESIEEKHDSYYSLSSESIDGDIL